MDSSYSSGHGQGGLFPPESTYGDWVNQNPSMLSSSSNNNTTLSSSGQQDVLADPSTMSSAGVALDDPTASSEVMDFLMSHLPHDPDAAAGSGEDSILQQHLIAQQIALQQIQLQNEVSNKSATGATGGSLPNINSKNTPASEFSSKTTDKSTVPDLLSTELIPEKQEQPPAISIDTSTAEEAIPEDPPQVLLAEQRLQQGLCPSCGQQLYKISSNKAPKWKKFFQLGGNNKGSGNSASNNTSNNSNNTKSGGDISADVRQKPLHIPGVVHRGQCVKCTKTNGGQEDDEAVEDFDNNPFLQDDGMDDEVYLQSSILNPMLRPDDDKDKVDKQKDQDGQVLATYEGPLNAHGQRHGNGTLKWSNGDVYKGNFINGVRHGPGSITFAKGKGEYVGDWENNLMHGQGSRRFPNGDLYVGPYVHGRREGTDGRFYYTNGDLFVGCWQEDRMHGFGRYYYHHGQRFEGDFYQGMRHGKGKLQRLDGSIDCFRYRNNQRQGTGARFSADRKSAWKLVNGRQKKTTIAEAVSIMYEIENAVEGQTSTAHTQDIPMPQGLTV